MKQLTTKSSSLRQRNIQIAALEKQNADLGGNEKNDPPFKETVNFQSDGHTKNGDDSDSSDDDDIGAFESHLVIEFAKDINEKTLHWIIDKIRGKKSALGCAGLILRREPREE